MIRYKTQSIPTIILKDSDMRLTEHGKKILNMSTIIFNIGAPSSGKSFYYLNNYSDKNYTYLSADAIRKELLGDENNQSQGNYIFKVFYQRLEEALKNKENIYIDNTNATRKSRKDIFKRIKKYNTNNDYHIQALVFIVPFYKLVWRDLWRKKRVGYKVINRFLLKLELPEKDEVFHSIDYIK